MLPLLPAGRPMHWWPLWFAKWYHSPTLSPLLSFLFSCTLLHLDPLDIRSGVHVPLDTPHKYCDLLESMHCNLPVHIFRDESVATFLVLDERTWSMAWPGVMIIGLFPLSGLWNVEHGARRKGVGKDGRRSFCILIAHITTLIFNIYRSSLCIRYLVVVFC